MNEDGQRLQILQNVKCDLSILFSFSLPLLQLRGQASTQTTAIACPASNDLNFFFLFIFCGVVDVFLIIPRFSWSAFKVNFQLNDAFFDHQPKTLVEAGHVAVPHIILDCHLGCCFSSCPLRR